MSKQKHSKTDFSKSDLPKNRKEVFFDILKVRYSVLLKLGLIILISLIPLLVVTILEDGSLSSVYMNLQNGTLTEEQYAFEIATLSSLFAAVKIIAFMILSVALAGSVKVIKNLIWGEPIFFKEDFVKGIKDNLKNYILASLLLGSINLGVTFTYYSFTELVFLKVIFYVIFYVLIIPSMLFVCSMSSIYNMTFLQLLGNGLILYIKTLPKTLLATLPFFLILATNFIGLYVVKYIALLVLGVFFIPLYMTGFMLYSCYTFDKYINLQFYPEIVDKGIYRNSQE